jgi:hypothetical protein
MTDDLEGTAGYGRLSLPYINDEAKFYPHQISGVRHLAGLESFLLADEMGGGKAQPNHTPVMTPSGSVSIGELKKGDVICRPSGGTQTVVAVHPQGIRDCARVTFSDGTSTVTSWDHRWAVSKMFGHFEHVTTQEMYDYGLDGPDSEPIFEIPLPSPVEYSKPYDLDIDPWTLGFVLADGLKLPNGTARAPDHLDIRTGLVHEASRVRIPNTHVVSQYPGSRVAYSNRVARIACDGSDRMPIMKFIDALQKHMKLIPSKRSIPSEVLMGPIGVRHAVFRGMLAAGLRIDRMTTHRTAISFPHDTNPAVIHQTVDLIRSLGGLAVPDAGAIEPRVVFWFPVPISLQNGMRIITNRPRRSVVRIAPAGRMPCTCITVSDEEGLYLTNDFIVTHNSLQALTVAAIDFERGTAHRVLIVCPATLKDNWAGEIEKHTKFNAAVLAGDKPKRETLLRQFMTTDDYEILIVNYEQVKGHLDLINGCNFDIVIFDEAHYLKNPKSQRTKACHSISARRSFVLTGSPMLNQPNELWGLLHRINPLEFPKYWPFVNRFCNTPDAPITMADGTHKLLGDIEVGDKVLGWDVPEQSTRRYGRQRIPTESTKPRRTVCESEVLDIRTRCAEVYEYLLDDGTTFKCTPDHLWLSGSHNTVIEWTTAMPATRGTGKGTKLLSRVVGIPRELDIESQRDADWLGGMMDGEGTWPFLAQSPTHNPETYAEIGTALNRLKVPYRCTPTGYYIKGGRQTALNFLNWARLVKRDHLVANLYGSLNRTKVKVISCRSLGIQDVVSMETTTGNYIAWGLASKNCKFGGYNQKQVVGVRNRIELLEILDRYMLRRLKADMVKLPDKNFIQETVPLSPLQKKLYKEAETDLQLEVPGMPDPMEMENALTKMLRLKQITGTPFAVDPSFKDESYKLDRAVEICQELIGDEERVVVFTQFRGVQAAMSARLDAVGVRTWQLHGDVAQPKRVPIVNDWGTAAPGVLVCMVQVGGVGLDFTAASNVIFLDKLYVPALNDQAVDRLHRLSMDKTKQVNIFELIAKGTVEDRVERILAQKRKLGQKIIDSKEFRKLVVQALKEE